MPEGYVGAEVRIRRGSRDVDREQLSCAKPAPLKQTNALNLCNLVNNVKIVDETEDGGGERGKGRWPRLRQPDINQNGNNNAARLSDGAGNWEPKSASKGVIRIMKQQQQEADVVVACWALAM